MNRQNRINHLIQSRTIAEQAEAAYQAEFTQQVTSKVERLAAVILSVSSKMNDLRDKRTRDENVALGDLIWARRRIVVEDFNETGFTVALHSKDGSRPPRDREQIRTFSWDLLSLSDRDMAKLTRATITQNRPALLEKQLAEAQRVAKFVREDQERCNKTAIETEHAYHRAVARQAAKNPNPTNPTN